MKKQLKPAASISEGINLQWNKINWTSTK